MFEAKSNTLLDVLYLTDDEWKTFVIATHK